MSNVFTYGNIELAKAANKGIITPDADGYYRIAGGGFNTPNRLGITYKMNQYLLECLEEGPNPGQGSDLRRRLDRGEVYMEMNHPVQWFYEKIDGKIVRTQITDVMMWINRLKTIDMDRVCAAVSDIVADFSQFNRSTLTGPVLFDILTKPFGPFGQYFQENLDTPKMGTAVSIRTVTSPQQFGDRTRNVEYWTGLDWVPEPGFAEATKYRTSTNAVGGLESLMIENGYTGGCEEGLKLDVVQSIEMMEAALGDKNSIVSRAGMESFNQFKDMLETLKKGHHIHQGKREIITSVNPLDLF